MQKKYLPSFTILLLVIAAFIGYAMFATTQDTKQTNGTPIVTTFYPLYEFAKHITGDHTSVTNITPAGVETHDYDPSPQALAIAQKADVFVYNGGTMEPWVNNFLKEYKQTAIKGSANIDLLTSEEGSDPHYWLDPTLARQTVNNIENALSKANPNRKDLYAKNAAAYNAQLAQLDTDLARGLQTCQSRTIVTAHNAFSYFAKRYNLEVVPIAGLSPEEEPSPAKLAEVSTLVRQKNIKYIFFESLVSSRLADTIAQETGAKTVVFDPIEGVSDEDQKQGKNYISIQRDNLSALRTALACQ